MEEEWFMCTGYRVNISFWNCIENQLSDFCFPEFPCHTCEAALTIALPPRQQAPLKVRYPKDWKNMTPAVRRSYGLR